MRLVYICSPYRGDYETNIKNAVCYCKSAMDLGVVAFAPHLYFAQFCEDTIPKRRAAGLEMGLNMLEKADELWVMGTVHSEGMLGEIKRAGELDIPVYYVPEPLKENTYPVSFDQNRLLTGADCKEGSQLDQYKDKLVVLTHEALKPEYRTPRNQIWYASHGPGSRPDCKFSDTVHLCHPVDHDTLCVSRRAILGVVKPEVWERLETLYPEFLSQGWEDKTLEPGEFSR